MVVHHVSTIVSTTSVTNDYDDCNGNNQSLLPSSFAVRFIIIIITLFVIIIMNICITYTYKINMVMYVRVFLFADMQPHKLWISLLYKYMYRATFIILVGQI